MPDLIYNVKFNIEDNLQEGAAGADRFENEVKELKAQVRMLNEELEGATNTSKQFNQQTANTQRVQRGANKQIAVGNQLFFSMSDGLQDSAQFSQGFSTGMRAVGNNIGFTAELAGNFIQRTKEMNGGVLSTTTVMKGLASSFFGVGGIILAINTAVTLFTVFGDKLTGSKEKADALKKSLDAITEAADDQATSITKMRVELGLLDEKMTSVTEQDIEQQKDLIDNLVILEAARERELQDELELLEQQRKQLSSNEDLLENADKRRAVQKEINELRKGEGVYGEAIDKQQSTLEDMVLTLQKINILERARMRTDAGVLAAVLDSAIELDKYLETIEMPEIDTPFFGLDDSFDVRVKNQQDTMTTARAQEFDLIVSSTKKLDKFLTDAQMDFSQITQDATQMALETNQEFFDEEEARRQEANDRQIRRMQDYYRTLGELARNHAQNEIDLEKAKEDSRIAINKSAQNVILGLSNLFAQKNRGLALLMLGIEKGLKVAEVATSANKNISVVQSEASAAFAKAAAAVPGAGILAGAAAASPILAQIPLIKATSRASIAAILAQGLGEGARIMGGAGGSAGGGGGSAAFAASPAIGAGFSEADEPLAYNPRAGFRSGPNQRTIVNFNVDETGFAFKVQGADGVAGANTLNMTSSDA